MPLDLGVPPLGIYLKIISKIVHWDLAIKMSPKYLLIEKLVTIQMSVNKEVLNKHKVQPSNEIL